MDLCLKKISTKWNAYSLVKDLNFDRRLHLLRRFGSFTFLKLYVKFTKRRRERMEYSKKKKERKKYVFAGLESLNNDGIMILKMSNICVYIGGIQFIF